MALHWLFAAHSLSRVISAGFAGALDPALRVGDVVQADEVIAADQRAWRAGDGRCPPDRRLLTLGRIVGDPSEKRLLGQQYGACAVDMESAVVAEHCAARGVPWHSLRAVSDDADTGLSPRLAELLAGERVSWWRFALAILRAPGLIGECLRLSRATRLAAERLAGALHERIDDSGQLRDGMAIPRARPSESAGRQIGDAHEGNRAQADAKA
jgi:adenosylhomocysteine nucleosidase